MPNDRFHFAQNRKLLGDAMMRLWLKRRWLRLAVVSSTVLAALLGPYVFSRVASSWRAVAVYSAENGRTADRLSPESPLKVACYNIAHGRGLAASSWDGDGRGERMVRLDRIAELLRTMDADVVVLNEVDFDSSWSYSVNQARYLAEKAGYSYWVEQRNLDARLLVWKWRFGNAVLSRYPIAQARLVDLPDYDRWETILAGGKGAVACDIELGDRTVCIVGAHLEHRSERVRVMSARRLASLAAGSRLPTILAGDLNSTARNWPEFAADVHGANAIETLIDSGRFQRPAVDSAAAGEVLTYPSLEPRCAIDWVLIPPDWRYVDCGVGSSVLSDHRPVMAEIVW